MAIVNISLEKLVFVEKPNTYGFKDLTGKVYQRLVVLGYAGKKKNRTTWFCACDCGNICKISGSDMKAGLIKSCGCYKIENSRDKATKHGMRFTNEYKIYLTLKDRCTNPNTLCYSRYGGKGVEVRLTFEEFFAEIGCRPSKEHSVDRINGSRHYEKGNIRWATAIEQANNRSNNHRFTYLGESKTLAEWARSSDLSYATIKKRRYRGWCEHHTLMMQSGALKPKDCQDCNPSIASITTF